MLGKLKDLWWIAGFAIAIASGYIAFEKIDAKASEAIQTSKETKEIAKQNQEINTKLAALITSDQNRLEMFLQFSGFDLDQARKWAAVPRVPEVDSSGNIVLGCEWLVVDSEAKVGNLYTWSDSGAVLVMNVWDFRPKKDK